MASATASPATVTTWNLDPAHSAAEFKVRHMMISNVKGSFSGLKGVLKLNDANPAASSVRATADISSVSTGDPQRDGHLKSADFFDAAQFPEMVFQSTAVNKTGEGEYKVTGDLTIHGVTHPVTFAVEGLEATGKDPWGNVRIGLTATAKVNRKVFGLSWNSPLETGGVLVGEEVAITLEAQFIRQ